MNPIEITDSDEEQTYGHLPTPPPTPPHLQKPPKLATPPHPFTPPILQNHPRNRQIQKLHVPHHLPHENHLLLYHLLYQYLRTKNNR